MSEEKTRRVLTAFMVVQFAVGGALLPFVSLLLRDRGLNFTESSRVFLSASATLLLFPFIWGMLADRFIPLNRLFAVLNTLAAVGLALLIPQHSFLGVLLCYTFFYACFNPTMMLINPLCFHHLERPAEQFGPLRAWGSFGWIIPSMVIYAWFTWGEAKDLTFVLGLALIFAVVAIVVSFRLPHTEPGSRAPDGQGDGGLVYRAALRLFMGNVDFLAILVCFFLVAASFSIYAYYSAPLLEDLGLNRAWIGLAQSLGVVLEVFLFSRRRKVGGKPGYARPILLGCAALMLRQLLCAFTSSLPVLIASYLLVGMVVVFFYIEASLLVNQMAPLEVRATAQTLLVLCGSGLGPMFGNFSAGWLTQAFGQTLRPVFFFAAVLNALAFVIIFARRQALDSYRTTSVMQV